MFLIICRLYLETNEYFDKGLAMNLMAQSLIFSGVQKLMVTRGLIVDGLTAIAALVQRLTQKEVLFTVAGVSEAIPCLLIDECTLLYICTEINEETRASTA